MGLIQLLKILVLTLQLVNEVSRLRKAFTQEEERQIRSAREMMDEVYKQALESPGA